MRGPVAMSLAALLFGLAGQQLFFARAAGLNVLLATALLLALAWWLRPGDVDLDLADIWLPAAAIVFAAFCAIRTDAALVAFDGAAAGGLTIGSLIALGGTKVARLDAAAIATELADMTLEVVDRPIRLALVASGPIARWLRSRTGRVSRYASGAVLASPFLIVFGALFASADPVFARWTNQLLDVERWRELFRDDGLRLLLAIVLTWLAAATLAQVTRGPRPHVAKTWPGAVHVEAATVLVGCIDLLFALFVALQVGYLFGGRDTIDAAGVPYSAYARRGFFELIGCAALVVGLLFGLGLQSRTRSRITAGLELILVGLTLVVLASAWFRMGLYQLAYGWTELRFYALTGIAFLGLALPIVAFSVVADRMRFVIQPLAAAALVVAIGVNVLSPSAFVARADLQRSIDPSGLPDDAERRMDATYLVGLGDGALPVLIETLPVLPSADRDRLVAILRATAVGRRNANEPWESLNLDRARAALALEALP